MKMELQRKEQSNVVKLKPWQIHEFFWGCAIKHAHGPWQRIILKPNGQEIDVSNIPVILHNNCIEFLVPEREPDEE